MSDPFLGEIRLFAGNYAPEGWALCDGRLLGIQQNSGLFSLLGTTYGGDGRATFALPDLRGRSAVHPGSNSQNVYELGEAGGSESVALRTTEMPSHTHAPRASDTTSTTSPVQARWATQPVMAYTDAGPDVQMAPDALQPAGAGLPHDNMPPFVALTYIIALDGEFPQRQ